MLRPTTIVECPRLARRLDTNLFLASETFQLTGSFKFRAAYEVVSRVPQHDIITASSGNFGQAIAYACSLFNKSCVVVMPLNSARVKVEAVRECGGTVELVDIRTKSRLQRVAELASLHPDAYVASSYDDPLVIQGNSSLGRELGTLPKVPDVIVAPVGGGGLIAGIVAGLEQIQCKATVIGAEPLLANDAARSLRAGRIVANEREPDTLADGAKVLSVGRHPWEIIRHSVSRIIEVSEDTIRRSLRLLYDLANLKVEPTGALAVAAVLTSPEVFRNLTVCCVVSGGNVDPDLYAKTLLNDEGLRVQLEC